MSSETPTDPQRVPETGASLEDVLRNEGRTLMIVGGLVAVLGLGAVLFPLVSSLTVAIFFGAALTIAGFGHVAHAFSAAGWKGAVGEILLALVYLVAGVAMLANPVLSLTTLTILVIAYFIAEGVVLLFLGWSLRRERGWVASVVSGAISLVLAGLLWIGFPGTAAWALGLLVGISLLSSGISMMVLGYEASRGLAPTTASPTRPDTGA